jgi:hypothetical protein
MKRDRAGERLWTRRLGDVSPAPDGGPLSLAADARGNVVVMGHGAAEVFLLRFDASGVLLRDRRFKTTGSTRHARVAVDHAGSAFLFGQFTGAVLFGDDQIESRTPEDRYLAKIDCGGSPAWAKRIAGQETSGFDVAVDPTGHVLLGAFQQATPPPGEGTPALFLAKLDPSGNELFARRYPGRAHGRVAASLAVDPRGHALLVGYLQGRIAFETPIDLTEGGLIRSPHENEAVFIADVGPEGAHRWSRSVAGADQQAGLRVLAGPGGAHVLGFFRGMIDFGGDPLWNDRPTADLFLVKLST